MNDEKNKFAVQVVESASKSEKKELEEWLKKLLEIKVSKAPKLVKAKKAIKVTSQKRTIFPIVRLLSKTIKKHAWDNRGARSRFGLIGIGAGITIFGGQSAGIAALGGAVGVPLWIVFGAGGAFAGTILNEINMRKREIKNHIDVDYEIIDKEED